jgi:tetraacyldisaccharide 4'-kinase
MSGERRGPPGLAAVLDALAGLYGAAVKHRLRRYRRGALAAQHLPCRVVSVGNLTVGGTGKTPMTVYVARLMAAAGLRAAVVSRGYKGAAEARGGVVSDGRRLCMGPAAAGDEPYLMARELLPAGIPVLVGRDRPGAGRLALRRFQSEVLLLDDGFQHLRLKRDLDLVLLDAAHPFGNGRLLPRGTLREPIAALARADACLLTRCPQRALAGPPSSAPQSGLDRIAGRRLRPVFPAAHRPYFVERLQAGRALPLEADRLPELDCGAPVFAFSGLARNRDFRSALQHMGFALKGWMDFADHHAYSSADLRTIADRARRCGARLLVTSQKDRVKIDPAWIQALPLVVIGVRIDLGRYAGAFEGFVYRHLGLERRSPDG